MESRVIEITAAAHKHGNLNLAPCGAGFFPQDAIGGSTEAQAAKPLTIKAPGLPNPVKTDIPTDNKTGRPRWLFRQRAWVKSFIRANGLIPGDTVSIRRNSNRTYELIPHHRKLTFIDLFAGIGGTRIAFEAAGCKCVFSCEWDKFAQETYLANFGERPAGNITKTPSLEIHDHDMLVAGFPCQPFSTANSEMSVKPFKLSLQLFLN